MYLDCPALTARIGARNGKGIAALVGAAVLSLIVALPAHAAVSAGKVKSIRGSATATTRTAEPRELQKGAQVFAGEKIDTGSRSFVLLEFADKTRFALGQNSTMEVNEFVYKGSAEEDTLATRVLKGAFRFVSGLISKRKPRSMAVRLGVIATIGLRGTTVAGEVDGDTAQVVLMDPEDPDRPTAIEVFNDFGAVTIDEPGFGTDIPDANSPPSPPRRMKLRTIENLMRTLQSVGRVSVPRPRGHMR
jgi:hypothetical protein